MGFDSSLGQDKSFSGVNPISSTAFRYYEFCELYEADVDINTENSLDNSGSNETMQKVLALIVWLWRNFQKKFGGQKFRKLELLYFSSDLGEI